MKHFMKRSIWPKAIGLTVGLLMVLALVWQSSRVSRAALKPPAPIHLTALSAPFTNPIGIDWSEFLNKLIVSDFYPDGNPENFNSLDPSGNPTRFSNVHDRPDELKLAVVHVSLGGFTQGDVYAGNGFAGQILKLDKASGTMTAPVADPFSILPGETAHARGSLFHDRYGVAGGDLIVVTGDDQVQNGTPVGKVWRVNSLGFPTLVHDFQKHLEGVITLPNDTAKYGPIAGRILVGDEDRVVNNFVQSNGSQCRVLAVEPTTGAFITLSTNPTVPGVNYHLDTPLCPEDLDVIPHDAPFYGVAFRPAPGRILTAPAADFDSFCGDILVTHEFPSGNSSVPTPAGVSGLFVLHWNAGTAEFDVTPLSTDQTIDQWEHVTFAGGTDCPTTSGKDITIGPSSMEGAIKIDAGDFVNGGYSFKTNFTGPITISANVSITGKCIAGSVPLPPGTMDTLTVPLGSIGYNAVAGSDWKPTGDANSILSWQGSIVAPATLCGGNGAQLDASKGAVFNATISGVPAGGLVTFRFKFRDPAAKGKPNTDCTNAADPNRNRADVCGASWSATKHDP